MPNVIPQFSVGDILELKKPHPCGSKSRFFTVLRVGSDIRIVCRQCGRDLTIPRIRLERMIKKILPPEIPDKSPASSDENTPVEKNEKEVSAYE